MNKSNIIVILGVILIFMNAGYILVTLKAQDIIELIYNCINVSLNIIYILLSFFSDE